MRATAPRRSLSAQAQRWSWLGSFLLYLPSENRFVAERFEIAAQRQVVRCQVPGNRGAEPVKARAQHARRRARLREQEDFAPAHAEELAAHRRRLGPGEP